MGYEVCADVMRLHGGIDWARELEGALRKRAVKLLLVCTPGGLEKRGVRNEIEIAVNLVRQLGDNSVIVPLRLQAYDAPFRIAQAQYIDFKASWAEGLAELAELLRDKGVPLAEPGAMATWLETHSEGADQLPARAEPLVSNWLQVQRQTIGYGFRDGHINRAIEIAVQQHGLRMFVIDPLGSDLARSLNPTAAPGHIRVQTALEAMFQQSLMGASRRGLREMFGGDGVEHDKGMQFFE